MTGAVQVVDTALGLIDQSNSCVRETRRLLSDTRYLIAASRRRLNPAFTFSGSSDEVRPEPPEPEDLVLLALVRHALVEGKIPGRDPDHLRAVPGSRVACSLCDLPVQSETDMQLYFRNGGAMYHLHVRCFMGWEIERHNGRGSAAV